MSTTPRTTGPQSLTPEQQRAVFADHDRILVVASAGSGKTEVLTRRLARLLSDSAGESFRCLAVTYTVKAAQELRRRIEASVAAENWRVDADTLHGFALEWLRQYGQCVDVSPDVIVYSDDADRARLILEYLASLGLHEAVGREELPTLRPVLAAIDEHRTLRPHEDFPEETSEFFGVPASELYEGYLDALDQAGGIDFPGMLAKLQLALEVDPWIGENFRSLFSHVLVDEAQDLTPAQTQLLRRLVRNEVAVFAVADDRQSINGFAGGSFENARVLVGLEAATHPMTLSHNFRSSARVLSAAEALAGHFLSNSVAPTIVATAPPGTLTVAGCQNTVDEAKRVADWIQGLLDDGLSPHAIAEGEDPTVDMEDIAVIGRTRWNLDAVLAELEARSVTYAVQVEASGFLDTPEGRIALDALAVEANSNDAPARRRIAEELDGLGVEPSDDYVQTFKDPTIPSLQPVAALLERARGEATLDEVIACLDAAAETWADDAATIRTLWADYRSSTDAKNRTLTGLLRHVAHSQRVRPTDPGVRVMSIHRVKGLEFRAVAVVGVREGALPDYRAKTPKQIDAERRAFYVAITRASRNLLVTWPRITYDRYDRIHHQQRSRFLDEARL